jgi:hypothetical protein
MVLIYFLVPETKQYSLEELDFVFGVPRRTFASYKAGYLVKAVRHYVFRQKVVFTDLYEDRRQN